MNPNPYAQEISRLILGSRPLRDRVHATEAWTVEGREARQKMMAFVAQLRAIAEESGEVRLVEAVESFYCQLRSVSPNLFPGGSLN